MDGITQETQIQHQNALGVAGGREKGLGEVFLFQRRSHVIKTGFVVNSKEQTLKILALKFKYLGDVAVMTPALRALHQWKPEAELHVLVAEDAAPLLRHLPWITKVWSLPRKRGRAQLGHSWPVLRALRAEHFDWSVDFAGNDRGAIVSRFIGARERLGLRPPLGFWGRRWCYHQTRIIEGTDRPEARKDWELLQAWSVPAPQSWELDIRPDSTLASWAADLLQGHPVVCHVSTSQPKKEWPVASWRALAEWARAREIPMVFSSGPSGREQHLLDEIGSGLSGFQRLPVGLSLDQFMAVVGRAGLFVSGDTGPMHLAAGLKVPTLALFGPTFVAQWAPQGPQHEVVMGGVCSCSGHAHVCVSAMPCVAGIKVDAVAEAIGRKYQARSV
jgi:ADP-heptose:LPS heptosyltransferase